MSGVIQSDVANGVRIRDCAEITWTVFNALRPSCAAVSVVEPWARPSRRPALSIVATFTALLDHEGVTVRVEPSDSVAVAVYAFVEPART